MSIEIIDNLTSRKSIEEILERASSWYFDNINGYIIKKRGIIFTKSELYSHKWTNNGTSYDFCLKCGIPKQIEKYWTHGCPVSAKQYNKLHFAEHNYKTIEVKDAGSLIWIHGSGYKHQPSKTYRFKVCKKCGLIPEREKVYYKLDKATGRAYEVPSPVGAKTKRIHCCLTDDEYDVKDIII